MGKPNSAGWLSEPPGGSDPKSFRRHLAPPDLNNSHHRWMASASELFYSDKPRGKCCPASLVSRFAEPKRCTAGKRCLDHRKRRFRLEDYLPEVAAKRCKTF